MHTEWRHLESLSTNPPPGFLVNPGQVWWTEFPEDPTNPNWAEPVGVVDKIIRLDGGAGWYAHIITDRPLASYIRERGGYIMVQIPERQ